MAGIHLTRLSTEGLGPRYGEVRRAHQMLNAALHSGELLISRYFYITMLADEADTDGDELLAILYVCRRNRLIAWKTKSMTKVFLI
jgi:hypothetical protein